MINEPHTGNEANPAEIGFKTPLAETKNSKVYIFQHTAKHLQNGSV